MFEIQSILKSGDQTNNTYFLPYLPKKLLIKFYFFFEHVSTCKKSDYFIDFAGDIIHLKILQSDWQRTFWPISQEQEFYQI